MIDDKFIRDGVTQPNRRQYLVAGSATLASAFGGCLGSSSVGDGGSTEASDPKGSLKLNDQTTSGNHVTLENVSTNVVSLIVLRTLTGDEIQDRTVAIRPGSPTKSLDIDLNPVLTEDRDVTAQLVTKDGNEVLAKDTDSIGYEHTICRFVERPTAGDTEITLYRSTTASHEPIGADDDIGTLVDASSSFSADPDDAIGSESATESSYWYKPGYYGVDTLPLNEDHEKVPLSSGMPVTVSLVDKETLAEVTVTVE